MRIDGGACPWEYVYLQRVSAQMTHFESGRIMGSRESWNVAACALPPVLVASS